MASVGGDDVSYVNPVLKYTVFFCNFLFWLVGAGVLGIGIWTYIEKNRFYHVQIKTIYDAIFDISIVFVILGIIIFILGLAGCVGALRENICLLKFFYYFLVVIFLLLLAGAVAAFLMRNKFKKKMTTILQESIIPKYSYDDDAKSIVNWVQQELKCCGVGIHGYMDWNENEYFNCTNHEKTKIHTTVQCAVPYSCCKHPDDITGELQNTKCGAGVLTLSVTEASKKIYTKGCIEVAVAFIENHLPVVGGLLIAFTVPILTAAFLVRCLQGQISDQKARW